ncbi:GNAT family N-acetyltransferase [Edaphocola flava]|uniref:GNAT family N-acetyltransferase n=1 Tax=Edaphocola flava TaxID=2499629 RepID=UPI00100B2D66|nr:GNAT family N-acetyltransferase [Edaphocola flava]
MLHFSPAQPEHLHFINRVYNDSIPAGLATADTEPLPFSAREEWYEAHQKSDRPVWILINEAGAPAGWLSLSNFYGRPAYRNTAEVSMYIANEHQGKGYGKMALNQLIEMAPELGISNLLGFIFAHNEPSLKLFTRAGFEEWGRLPEIAHMPQAKRTLVILGKKI